MNTFPFRSLRACASLALALAALTLAAGCERVAPVRTLPTWVRGIYVPMFKNKSFEPAIEETATRLTQEAFLADGRLDIVPERDADLKLVAEITDWKSRVMDTTGEQVATREEVVITANVKLYQPFNEREPLADLGPVRVDSTIFIDTRSTGFEPEPDRKVRLLKQLATQIVWQTIDGFPAELVNVPAGVELPKVQVPETIRQDDIFLRRKGSRY